MSRLLSRSAIFIVLAALLALPNSAGANSNSVYISLAMGDEYYLSVGDNVLFGWGWATVNRGLTNHFVRSTSHGWTLYDSGGIILSEYSSDDMQGWGEGFEFQVPASWNCPGRWASGEGDGWARHWDQDPSIIFTEPGTYTIDFYYTLDHPIHDICDIDQDGHHDVYEQGSNTITIFVSE